MLDNPDGTQTRIIRPALSNSTREVIGGMSDIYGYAHQKKAGEMSVLTLRCSDGTISCGNRFKYMPDEISMSYDNLINAICEAIDKEAAEHDNQFVTDERIVPAPMQVTYDYDTLMAEFETLVGELMNKNQTYFAPRVTSIVDHILGKGRKVSDTTPDQAEFVFLINQELKELT